MKLAAILGLGAGLTLVIVLISAYGLDEVATALLAVGWTGFAAICAIHAAFTLTVALAWRTLVPGTNPLVFVWARLIRDGGSDVLALSQVGGLAMGVRAAILRGVPGPVAVAATTVDVTLELLAQIASAMVGLAILIQLRPGSPFAYPAALVLGGAVAVAVLFMIAQRRGFAALERVARRMLGMHGAGASAAAVHEAIAAIYRNRRRLLLGALLHLMGWCAGGVASWLALGFMGVPLAFAAVLAIESLLSVIRSAAFIVPNAYGVQEGAYIALGSLFGMGPETALALSLLRRARDLTFGVPALLAWQLAEGRRAFRAGAV